MKYLIDFPLRNFFSFVFLKIVMFSKTKTGPKEIEENNINGVLSENKSKTRGSPSSL